MSVDTTMAVLYAQSGLSNMANVAATAPQASLAMSRVLAAEQARQERQQVEKSDKSEKSNINPEVECAPGTRRISAQKKNHPGQLRQSWVIF